MKKTFHSFLLLFSLFTLLFTVPVELTFGDESAPPVYFKLHGEFLGGTGQLRSEFFRETQNGSWNFSDDLKGVIQCSGSFSENSAISYEEGKRNIVHQLGAFF